MNAKKITEFPTAAALASTDIFPLVDTAAVVTKKIVADKLFGFADHAYFVGAHGNDLNNGKSWRFAFKTLGKAITEANAQTPAIDNRYVIVCIDAGVYTENIILGSFVSVYAPSATLNGYLRFTGDENFACFHRIEADDLDFEIAWKSAGGGHSTLVCNELDITQARSYGVYATSGVLTVHIAEYYYSMKTTASDDYAAVDAEGAGTVVNGSIDKLQLVTNTKIASGVYTFNTGIVAMDFKQIVGNANSIGIEIPNGNAAYISVNELDCPVAYNNAGTLYITTGKCSGTETNTGVLYLSKAGHAHPRRVAAAAAAPPTPQVGEVLMWEDTTNNKVYLMYNDTVQGTKKVELT